MLKSLTSAVHSRSFLLRAGKLIHRQDRTVTPSVLEMGCRLNSDANNFERVAENLARTAQVRISGEWLRQLVIVEGQAVLAAQRAGAIPTAFPAEDCLVDPGHCATCLPTAA